MRSFVFLLLVPVALAGCNLSVPVTLPKSEAEQTAPAGDAIANAPASASAANDNLNAVSWIQRSVEYQAVTTTLYRAAAEQLDAAVRQGNWDALAPQERGNVADGLKPAIIMDVDETVLDNSPYQARLIANGEEYNEVSWDRWVAEKKAKAVPGVVAFAKAAQARGITLLYLSNRAEHLQAATLENLRAVGMPVANDEVFLGLGTFVEGCEQNGSEKNCRRQLAGRNYRIVMQFGDQLGDFVQVLANTPEGRAAIFDDYRDWFGERWWMLPNPSYGSWEPALFNNDWQQAPEARRQRKREALDLAQ